MVNTQVVNNNHYIYSTWELQLNSKLNQSHLTLKNGVKVIQDCTAQYDDTVYMYSMTIITLTRLPFEPPFYMYFIYFFNQGVLMEVFP